MELKPGYKQTEVGVIPGDWDVEVADNLCVKIQDGTHFSPKLGGNDYLYITSKNIRFGYLDINSAVRISADEHQAIYKRCDVKNGDLLFTKDGANTGNAALNFLSEEISLLSSVAFLRFEKEKQSAEYFLQQILAPVSQSQIQEAMAGNAITRLTLKKIRQLLFPVPPTRAEQEAIAGALSDADGLIESLEQLIAKKSDLKQGAIQELLTGKKRLPGFSDKWERVSLGELFTFKNGLNKAKKFFGYGTPIVNYMDVFKDSKIYSENLEGRVSLTNQELRIFDIKKGDVLFTRTSETANEIGMASVMLDAPSQTVFSGFVLRARPKDGGERLCDEFKAYCFRAADVRAQIISKASYTTRALTNGRILSAVILALPKMKEQTAIATILSDMDAELAALEAKLAKARDLKQGMMQELLTGAIRLVATSAQVDLLPVEKTSVTKPAKAHNWQINEAVVVSVLVKHFGSEKYPLARKRCTKLCYLLHRHVEHQAEGYLKKAAGPYNPAVKYKGPEGIAQKNGYVRAHHNGTYPGFVAGENIAKAEAYFQDWYGADVISWLEKEFKFSKTDELELFATVDMAMEDLRREGKPVESGAVKQLIHDEPEWAPKLNRDIFSDANIARALQTCQRLFP